jgi:hypothetical protein
MSIEYHMEEYDRKNIRGDFAATELDTGGVLSAKTRWSIASTEVAQSLPSTDLLV